MVVVHLPRSVSQQVVAAFKQRRRWKRRLAEGFAISAISPEIVKISYQGKSRGTIRFNAKEAVIRPWKIKIDRQVTTFKSLETLMRGSWWNSMVGPLSAEPRSQDHDDAPKLKGLADV